MKTSLNFLSSDYEEPIKLSDESDIPKKKSTNKLQLIHKGYLSTKGKLSKTFKKRFFKLFNDKTLHYWKSDVKASSNPRLGTIDLKFCLGCFYPALDQNIPEREYSIEVATSTANNTWILIALNKKSLLEWIRAFRTISPPPCILKTKKEGFLRKSKPQGKGGDGWKKRWFALTYRHTLVYFESQEMCRRFKRIATGNTQLAMERYAKGSINLHNIIKITAPGTSHQNSEKNGFLFELVIPKRIYKILANTNDDYQNWVDEIKKSLDEVNDPTKNSILTEHKSKIKTVLHNAYMYIKKPTSVAYDNANSSDHISTLTLPKKENTLNLKRSSSQRIKPISPLREKSSKIEFSRSRSMGLLTEDDIPEDIPEDERPLGDDLILQEAEDAYDLETIMLGVRVMKYSVAFAQRPNNISTDLSITDEMKVEEVDSVPTRDDLWEDDIYGHDEEDEEVPLQVIEETPLPQKDEDTEILLKPNPKKIDHPSPIIDLD